MFTHRNLEENHTVDMKKMIRENDKIGKQVYLGVADSEKLPFDDCQFDTYVSNFSLMIVSDYQSMLSEAFRVLEYGGKMAVSVWGRKEVSPIVTILPQTMKECGVDLPPNRDYFHLSDNLDEVISNAGFKNLRFEYSKVLMHQPKEFAFYYMLGYYYWQKVWNSLSFEKQREIEATFYYNYEKWEFENPDKMLNLDFLVCMAEK